MKEEAVETRTRREEARYQSSETPIHATASLSRSSCAASAPLDGDEPPIRLVYRLI